MFDWITGFVQSAGYWGIALLMLAENVFPPIPSEVIMPLAGFIAARDELNIVGVVAAGTAGTLAGALIWYYVGLRLGLDRLKRLVRRHGRWLTLDEMSIDHASRWFARHGRMALVIGHLIPAVRTLISVPAGVNRMGLVCFLAASAAGTVLWTALLAGAGYLLENQYERVQAYANVGTNLILGLMVAWYLYRVATWPRAGQAHTRRPQDSGEDEAFAPARPRQR
jgi:membrane protein DedA with SNARE-associated domain